MDTQVPYIVHEGAMARMDRIIKRLWKVIILLIVMLVVSNGAWIYYESQMVDEEVVTTTQKVEQKADADSGDATINDGVHINGNSNADSND